VAAIKVSGLTHRYGRVTALRDVNLEVPEGALYALLGPNGSGKTTLLKNIMGLHRPSSGEVTVFGKNVFDLTLEEKAQIGYIAEGMRLPGWMTLAQLEAFCAPLYSSWDYALADELRARFKLDVDRKIKTLSRGETMKAALLCALACVR
jgi:ABC-2 type transport system ATP-binding protein